MKKIFGYVLEKEKERTEKIEEGVEKRVKEEKKALESKKKCYEVRIEQFEIAGATIDKLVKIGAELSDATLDIIGKLVKSKSDPKVLGNLIDIAASEMPKMTTRETGEKKWMMFNSWLERNYPNLRIPGDEMDSIPEMPELSEEEKQTGYIPMLCYGFKTDLGDLDIARSSHLAWQYLTDNLSTLYSGEKLQMKMDPDVNWGNLVLPATDGINRPKGFHWVKLNSLIFKGLSVGEVEFGNLDVRAAGYEYLQYLALNPQVVKNILEGTVPLPLIGRLRLKVGNSESRIPSLDVYTRNKTVRLVIVQTSLVSSVMAPVIVRY